ncbi:SpaA isopeptide-forming pilin-related protein [Enterococcus plantarum]|uniref:SpaA isopeptide-forming pilin-related protein n=1 Tax=Enterococcus plantarum TaxID=1077675 RepID=UPI001A8FD043|nr:SpaA isopeptide-forming pilin-related protein [Enterococcus plantarum]MBO0423375.1 hypothetical protein [Enterococcus plantarum]
MNYKQKMITGLKKSTTVLAAMLILGQTFMPGATAFAESQESTDTTTEQTASTTETVTKLEDIETTQTSDFSEKAKEIINDPLLTETEKTQKMYSVFSGMGKVSFGYTNKSGEQVAVQEKQTRFRRSALDTSEYTPYSFRVDLNGYWAEGQMPVLKMDGEVVFCIEPGVAAQAGEGYTPADLTAQQREWFENIGNFGYPKEQSHEMYYTSQGYMWQKMGASFSGSYGGFEAKKAQIDANIAAYYTRPSFHGQDMTVKMGEPVTVTDTNGVLSEYIKDVSTGGLKLTKNGNQLTIEVTENTADNAAVKMWKIPSEGTSIAYIKDGSQMTAKFATGDPAAFTLNVKAIKEGQIQIGKQDKITKKMVPNTTYTGTIGKDKVTFTTGADGWAPLSNKYVDGTEYNLVETAVPAGYTLDQTPIKGKIKGGETTKITQQNNHQNAVVTFEKEKEVFDAKETALKGTPVYKDIPLEGAEFTNKNNNDTTAPDQETVLTPAGEYHDTMLTDAEGKGKSTIPFVNGEQNEYIFDETNEPENYRQFEPVTFNVPYEVSTVDVATYDLGIFKNELKTGEIDFNKKSDLDLSSLLNITGAKIHVEGLSENTKDVNFTFTTSAETNKLKLKEGQYRFSEVEYPDGWTISPNQPHSMIVEVKDKTNSTINWENTKIPMKITTLFATVDGKKVIDPTKDNKLEDTVKVTDAWVNTPMTFYTEFVAVKYNNGVIINQRVVGTDETDKTFKEKNEEFKVPLDLKKDTLKEGEALVATHVAKDKDGKVIAEETDLYNKDQTVVTETAKVPEKPKTPVTPSTPTKTGTLPSMGETIQSTFMMIGFAIAALVGFLFVFKKAETDEVA